VALLAQLRPQIAGNFIGPPGAATGNPLAPSLLILGVLMCGLYTFLTLWSGRAAPPVTPRA
jgi:hypothetical protein